jgi:arginine utilization protein RocB
MLSSRQGPAVVIFYAPPYYPTLAPAPGILQEAIDAIVTAHPEINLAQQPYFPYLSDMSYLRLDEGVDPDAVKSNMPIWQPSEQTPALPGGYSLPLEEIKRLGIPVVNWGPFGRGAHQRDEAVCKSYTFGQLPQLLYETIEYIAQHISKHTEA